MHTERLTMDWDGLKEHIADAVIQSLPKLLAAHPGEYVYAIALYTDSSAMTVALAANSWEALEIKLRAEDELDRQDLEAAYTWATSEWVYEGWGGQRFEPVCERLRESEARSDFDTFKQTVISCMVEALECVSRKGIFESICHVRPILFVSMTDDNAAEGIENSSARMLNSNEVLHKFLARYQV